jgi:dolichol-phosphate mannosyltransferase
MNPLISVVSPVYRAERIVQELVSRISNGISSITCNYEIILICDGSPDNSWLEIEKCCKEDHRVIGINLSRNFGQHNAITAGLKCSRGDWVVVIDCDLQDNPGEIPTLFAKAMVGYDIVLTKRILRQDSYFKRLSSLIFQKVYNLMSGLQIDGSISNYGIYSRAVINEFNRMGEVARSFHSLISYLGFRTAIIQLSHSTRFEGKSSYSWKKLLKLGGDVILANSNKPLKMAIILGAFVTFVSFILIIYNFILYFTQNVISGFSSTIISIWLIGGLNMLVLGVFGLYIDKIFNQVKNRQLFIISKTINFNKDSNYE